MNTQSHQEFVANWDRQVGCAEQYDRSAADAVWSDMLQSDPVGATWGPGVHLLLFRASLEWLSAGTVNGMKTGMLKLGYASVPESR